MSKDAYMEAADMMGVTRAEAKKRILADAYGVGNKPEAMSLAVTMLATRLAAARFVSKWERLPNEIKDEMRAEAQAALTRNVCNGNSVHVMVTLHAPTPALIERVEAALKNLLACEIFGRHPRVDLHVSANRFRLSADIVNDVVGSTLYGSEDDDVARHKRTVFALVQGAVDYEIRLYVETEARERHRS